jgi:hypothetical protein
VCKLTSEKIGQTPKIDVGASAELDYSPAQFDFASKDRSGEVETVAMV